MKMMIIVLAFCGLLSLAAWLLNEMGFFAGGSIQPSALQLYGWVGVVAIGALMVFGRMLFTGRSGDQP
jgi:hypothetical protein